VTPHISPKWEDMCGVTVMNRPSGRFHVEREKNKAKFWLDPVRLQNSGGYNRNEINRIQRLIEENQKMLLEKWNDYFSD
jgi:hypothetical protein